MLNMIWLLLIILKGDELTVSCKVALAKGKIIEGDIAIGETAPSGNSPHMDAFLANKDKLWPLGNVYFRFELSPGPDGTWRPSFKTEEINMIRDAMNQIKRQVPCIHFR